MIRHLICMAAVSALVGCSSIQRKVTVEPLEETVFEEAVSIDLPSKELLKLQIGVHDIYCRETACSCIAQIAARQYDGMLKQLREKHNIELELEYYPEPYHLQDAIRKGKLDGYIAKPWLVYATLSGVDNVLRIADLNDPDDNPWLSGIFLVTKDSPIKTMADITGKRLVMGQEDAYEKYNSCMISLQEKMIAPSELIHKSSCSECVSAIMDGKADVAIVSDYALVASCIVDFAKPEDFREIQATEKIPLTSLLVDLKRVSRKDAGRLQRAVLLESGTNAPKDLLGKGFVTPAGWIPSQVKIGK